MSDYLITFTIALGVAAVISTIAAAVSISRGSKHAFVCTAVAGVTAALASWGALAMLVIMLHNSYLST